MLSQDFNTTDKIIRSALLKKLNHSYRKQNDTAIIPEFSLVKESVRIDLAVVNGIIHGYELKGDKDNLLRLKNQSNAYNLVFDKLTLVVGKSHIIHSIYMIPDWWGITVARTHQSGETSLYEVRKPKVNPLQDIKSMTDLLWKYEIARELMVLGKPKSIINKPKDYLCRLLIDTIEKEELKSFIRQTLKSRFFNSNWRADL